MRRARCDDPVMVGQVARKDPHRVFVAGPAMEQEQDAGRLRGIRWFSNPQSPIFKLNQFSVRSGLHVFESNPGTRVTERSMRWVPTRQANIASHSRQRLDPK